MEKTVSILIHNLVAFCCKGYESYVGLSFIERYDSDFYFSR